MKAPEIVSTTLDRLVLRLEGPGVEPGPVLATAACFTARAWVSVARDGEGYVLALILRDEAADQDAMRALADEVTRELFDNDLRQRIREDNRETIEAIHARAFRRTGDPADPPPPAQDGLDELGDLDDLDFLDDPLGIAVPWEEQAAKGRGDGGEGEGDR